MGTMPREGGCLLTLGTEEVLIEGPVVGQVMVEGRPPLVVITAAREGGPEEEGHKNLQGSEALQEVLVLPLEDQ